jgi:hypothetical protein
VKFRWPAPNRLQQNAARAAPAQTEIRRKKPYCYSGLKWYSDKFPENSDTKADRPVREMPSPRIPTHSETIPDSPRRHRELRLLYQRRAAVEDLIRAIEAYSRTQPMVTPVRAVSGSRKS